MKIKNKFMFFVPVFSLIFLLAITVEASPQDRIHCEGFSNAHRVLLDINPIAAGQSFYEFTFKDIAAHTKPVHAVIVGQAPVHGRSYNTMNRKINQLDSLSVIINREVAEVSYQLTGQSLNTAELECYGFFAIEGFAPLAN